MKRSRLYKRKLQLYTKQPLTIEKNSLYEIIFQDSFKKFKFLYKEENLKHLFAYTLQNQRFKTYVYINMLFNTFLKKVFKHDLKHIMVPFFSEKKTSATTLANYITRRFNLLYSIPEVTRPVIKQAKYIVKDYLLHI